MTHKKVTGTFFTDVAGLHKKGDRYFFLLTLPGYKMSVFEELTWLFQVI